MLNRTNASEICKQVCDVLNGPKRDVSRAYRRLFERLAPGGAITMVFGDADTLLTRTRYQQLQQYVQERVERWKEMDLLTGSVRALEPVSVKATTQVHLPITLLDCSPEEASLINWKEAAWGLRSLAREFDNLPDWQTQMEYFGQVLSKRRSRARVAAALSQ